MLSFYHIEIDRVCNLCSVPVSKTKCEYYYCCNRCKNVLCSDCVIAISLIMHILGNANEIGKDLSNFLNQSRKLFTLSNDMITKV